jgi:hypothetical protein
VAVAVIGLLALPTPLAVLGLVCWWLLVSSEVPGRTWARRGLLGIFVVFAINAGALTALAVLHVACRPRVLLAVLLLAALAAQVRRQPGAVVPLTSVPERWALALGAVVLATLSASVVGASSSRVMALLSRTTDGATHVQIVTALLKTHGYVQLSHPAGLSPGVDHYPSAWHANVWVLSDLLLGGHPGLRALLTLVAVCAVATLALTSTLAAVVVLDLAEGSVGPTSRSSLTGLVAVALLTVIGVGLLLLQLGSYTQLWAICAVLGVVLVAAEPYQHRSLVLAGACAVCLMQTWYLLGLALLVPLVVLLRAWRPSPNSLAAFLLLVVPLCLFPLVTGPAVTHVDAPGPKLLPPPLGVLGLLVAIAMGSAFALHRAHVPQNRALLATTAGAVATLCALLLRDGSLVHRSMSYYSAKVLLSTLLIGGVTAAVLVASAWASRSAGTRLAAAVAVLGLAAATWTSRSLTLPPRLNDYGGHLDPVTLEALVDAHPRGAPTGTISLVADGCDRVWDRVASKWLADTTLTWTTRLAEVLTTYSQEPRGDVRALQALLAQPDVSRVELFVRHECDASALQQLAGNPKVVLIRVPERA